MMQENVEIVRRSVGRFALMMIFLAVIGGCGGGGGGGTDPQQITDAITEANTSTDPKKCTEFQTQRAVEQAAAAFDLKGEAAVKVCEQTADFGNAESVEVTNIAVNDDTATADAAVTGGDLDGQTMNVKLVREDDQWKLDQYTRFVSFDRKALFAAFAREFPITAVRSCVISGLQRLTDKRIQDTYIRGTDTLARILEGCPLPSAESNP